MKTRLTFIFLIVLTVLAALPAAAQPKRLKLVFEGNKVFTGEQLAREFDKCEFEIDDFTYLKKDDVPLTLTGCLFDYVLKSLADKGYPNYTVGELRRENPPGEIKIFIPLEEGQRYKFARLTIEGATLFSPADFDNLFPLKKGDYYNQELIDNWGTEVKKMYSAGGFKDVDVEIETRYGDDESACLAVFIDEGKAFRIRTIYFSGNEQTRHLVLLRPLGLNEGFIYTEERLKFAIEKLNKKGVVEEIDAERDVEKIFDEKRGTVVLVIKVREKERGT